MKKLVMLLFVLALCVPSYGSVLVYKVTITDKPVIIDLNENTAIGTATSIKPSASFKGYLVFDVCDTTLETLTPDDNATPAIILNGTDPESKAKKQQWVSHGTVNIYKVTVGNKTYARLEWESNTGTSAEPNESDIDALGVLTGTVLVKGGDKVDVVKSGKGSGDFYKYVTDIDDDSVYLIQAGGNSSATITLDVAKTKAANAAPAKTVAAVIAVLK